MNKSSLALEHEGRFAKVTSSINSKPKSWVGKIMFRYGTYILVGSGEDDELTYINIYDTDIVELLNVENK